MKWILTTSWEVIEDIFKTTMKKIRGHLVQNSRLPGLSKSAFFRGRLRHENSLETRKQGHFYFISSKSFYSKSGVRFLICGCFHDEIGLWNIMSRFQPQNHHFDQAMSNEKLWFLVSIFPRSKEKIFHKITNRPPQRVLPIFGQMLKTHFSR